MRDEHGELHADTDEARAGSTPNIVRWILLVSLFAAIALLSIIWITGAATQDEEEGTVSAEVRDRDDGSGTDSIVSDRFEDFEAAEPGQADPVRTVENETEAPPPPAEPPPPPAEPAERPAN
jgi:hypothetical protein